MTDGKADRSARVPELVDQAAFETTIDHYVEAAERRQEFRLVRDGTIICRLGPAER